jgi:site-specific DNA-methyltransferase (adenine-specific)
VDEAGSTFKGDSGSAARFFYCAKADRADRNEGLQGLPEKPLLWSSGEQNPGAFQSPNTNRAAQNNHPTVKPTDLMRWLVRLVTPPGGVVLDPFLGSGSTLKAAELEGFDGIGIEREAEYIEIARRRIAGDAPLFAEVAT